MMKSIEKQILLLNTNRSPVHVRIVCEIEREFIKSRSCKIFTKFSFARFLKCSKMILPSPSPRNILFGLMCALFGKKVVFGVHDVTAHEPRDKFKVFIYNYVIAKLASALIVYSEFSKSNMAMIFNPSCPIYLYKFIANVEGQETKGVIPPDERRLDFLYFGRIKSYSGRERILKIVKSVPSKNFLIMGEGAPVELRSLPNVLLIDRFFSDAELLWALQTCHTVIFPYMSATQSGGVPTAILQNCNIVYHDVGGLADQIWPYPGVPIRDGDIDSFCSALVQLHQKVEKKHSRFWVKTVTEINRETIEALKCDE